MPKHAKPPARDAVTLEPRTVRLPAKPTYKKNPKVKKDEHKRWPRPRGEYRPIADLGKPTFVQEVGGDSPKPKR